MKFYKLRHIPTGLFFKPSTHGSKSNLSKKGKVYERKPSVRYLGDVYHHPVERNPNILSRWQQNEYESRKVIPSEWELVEFEVAD